MQHQFRLGVVGCLALALIVGTALAQPGGGRPGGNGGNGGRATPAAPIGGGGRATPVNPPSSPVFPAATGTRTAPSIGSGGQALPLPTGTRPTGERGTPSVFPTGMPTFIPEGTLDAYTQYLQDTYDLPDTSSLPAYSSAAATMLTNFSSQYLGIAPTMVYATEVDTSSLSYDQLAQILAVLPDEVAALVDSMTGTAYGGLYQDGVAALYTGTCSGVSCSTTQGQFQFVLQNGGLGIYGTYVNGTVTDANTALSLVRQTFPALNSISLTASSSDTGYAFVGQTTAQASSKVTINGYYAGTYTTGSYTLVYAAVGVGEGYAQMVKP